MCDTGGISKIAYSRLRSGVYVAAIGSEKLGEIRGDYSTGFWAYLNTGELLEGTHDEPATAAEVLALETAVRGGVMEIARAGV